MTVQARPQPRADRRTQILDTTLMLIAEGGVDAVTHRRIADRADIPLGSTTYYFKSRTDLIGAAFDQFLLRLQALWESIDIDPTASAEHLVDYLVLHTERSLQDHDMLLIEYEMTLYAARDDALAAALHDWYDDLAERVAEGLRALGGDDVEEGGRTILHMMRGHELEALSRGTVPDLRPRLERLVALYVS